MPTKFGKDIKGCYARWGSGTKYYYNCTSKSSKTRAKNKADKQGKAISISSAKRKGHKI